MMKNNLLMNCKEIHMGSLIQKRVMEKEIKIHRICNFFKCTENEIQNTFTSESVDSEKLLKWSKLLEYDFFRIYSQHMALYAPYISGNEKTQKKELSSLPHFRKNLYTQEMIDYMLNLYNSGEMSKEDVCEKYNIPKSTFYKWMNKSSKS